jgi:hypothetical protein
MSWRRFPAPPVDERRCPGDWTAILHLPLRVRFKSVLGLSRAAAKGSRGPKPVPGYAAAVMIGEHVVQQVYVAPVRRFAPRSGTRGLEETPSG